MIIHDYNFYNFTFKASDGQIIHAYKWIPKNDGNLNGNQIKAVLHIVHGMGEHARRYSEFAQYLNSFGFAVYAFDQRGHGKLQVVLINLVIKQIRMAGC